MTAALGGEPTEGLDEPLADVAAVEPDGFDAGQFLGDVQADVAGIRPPTPPKPEDDWDKGDTKDYLEEVQGSGPIVDPGLQPGKLTLANRRALDSLQQRPPKVEDAQVIHNQGPQMRHMGGEPLNFPFPPPSLTPPKAKPSGIDRQMASIMGGAGAPLGGQLAAQIEKQGQADEFQNLATAARRGQDIAQATYGLKGQERSLAQSQQAFRQQKAQDVMANLANRRGQRRPRTRVRVQA